MARIVDDRGRLFGKINIVDLIVLVLIVALAIFVGLRATKTTDGQVASSGKVPVEISFKFELADTAVVEAIRSGEGSVSDYDGRYIGTVEDVRVTEIELPKVSVQGQSYTIDARPAYEVVVVVASEGIVENGTIRVGSLAARAGANVQLAGPGWEGYARIIGAEQSAPVTE